MTTRRQSPPSNGVTLQRPLAEILHADQLARLAGQDGDKP
jgi:hypothetical protein